MPSLAPLALLLPAALLAACANPPAAPATANAPAAQAPADCAQLAAEQGRIETEQHLALEQQHSAWKAVIPFAVAARYAKSKSAADEAGQKLEALRAEAASQGCTTHATQGG